MQLLYFYIRCSLMISHSRSFKLNYRIFLCIFFLYTVQQGVLITIVGPTLRGNSFSLNWRVFLTPNSVYPPQQLIYLGRYQRLKEWKSERGCSYSWFVRVKWCVPCDCLNGGSQVMIVELVSLWLIKVEVVKHTGYDGKFGVIYSSSRIIWKGLLSN